MRRVHRLIYQETRGPILITLLVLTFVVFTREFGRLAELLIRRNTELETVGKAVVYLLPSILVFTIPFSFLIGTLIGFGRLSAESEIIALRTGGLSTLQTLWPVLRAGAVVTLLTAALVHLLPDANWKLRMLRHELRTAPVFSAVKPRVFFEEIPGLTLYVEDFDPATSTWENVFLADQSLPGETRLILARRGQSYSDREGRRLQLHFEDGSAYNLPAATPDRVSVSRFGTLDIPIELPADESGEARAKRPHDKSWSELRADLGTEQDLPSRVEMHRRLALPLSGLVFALLATALGIRSPRAGRSYGFLVSVTVAFLYYVLFATGSTLARGGVVPLVVGVWGSNLLVLGSGVLTLWFSDRESKALHRLGNWKPIVDIRDAAENTVSRWRRRAASLGARFHHPVRGLLRFRPRLARVVDLYMTRVFLVFFLSTVAVSLFLVLLFTFFEIVDDVYQHGIPYSTVADYFFFLQPHLLMLLIPISILIATLVTFGSLERTNQIIAFKSCGVSVFRIAVPVLLAGVALAGFSYVMQEYVLPYANQRQDYLRNVIKGNPVQTSRPGRRWIFGTEGRLFHYSHYASERRSFAELSVYRIDPAGGRLAGILFGSRAQWDPVGGRWELRSGWSRDLEGGTFETFDSRFARWNEGPDFFAEEVRDSSKMTYLELRSYIQELEIGGFEVDYLKTELYKKLSFPVVNVIMALLGVPFALTMGRRGALYGIAAGVLLGIAYWGTFGIFDVLGANGLLAPSLAAWAPNLVFGTGAALLLSGVRT